MFKKKKAATQHKRNIDTTEGEDDNAAYLKNLRLVQQARSKHKGVSNMPQFQEEVAEADSSEDEGGILNIEKHFGSTGTSRASQVVDKHLEKFLEEQLVDLKQNTKATKATDELNDESRQKLDERRREEQSIYLIPKEWSAQEYEIEKSEEMNWQAGLAEVPLDVQHRMDNIQKTEEAKRLILEQRRRASANDDATRARDQAMSDAFGQRFRNGWTGGLDQGNATKFGYDRLLENFMKQPDVPTSEPSRKGPY